jgi:methionine synthase I (cobalamin-dependent)
VAAAADLARRLARGEVVVLDGGMGTELQAHGVPMDDDAWCGVANLAHADAVQAAHEAFIAAGAEVVIANTFAAGRLALGPAGLGDRVVEANRRAVEAARRAIDRAATGPVAVAGSMSSLLAGGSTAGSAADPDPAVLLEAYREQATALAGAGVDLIALEMLQSPRHRPAVQAAAETGLPVWLGVSAGHADGGPMPNWSGDGDFEDALVALLELPVELVAVMHTNVEDVDAALEVVRAHWTGPLGTYPHSGVFHPPVWEFGSLTPDALAEASRRWMAGGVGAVGGCCGTGPEHIRRLRDEVSRRAPAAV